MKKFFLVACILASIKSMGQDEIETNCFVEGENSNLLNYVQTQLIAVNYHLLHNASKEKHTKAYYINSRTILFLRNFFKSRTQYFGFNIYLVSYRSRVARHQSRTTQSLLYLVPVYDNAASTAKDTTADYAALNAYFDSGGGSGFSRDSVNKGISCFGMCDSSIMAWTYHTFNGDVRRLNELPGAAGNRDIFLLTSARGIHDGNRANYRADHNELSGKQTKWVFFKKETIDRLAEFIEVTGHLDRFPLVGIYFGTYNKLQRPKQADRSQTVIGFIPMRFMANRSYEPDICSYILFQNQQKTKDNKGFTENHGELCPDDCPRGGN